MQKFLFVITIILANYGFGCNAQFRALQNLPWYPKANGSRSVATAAPSQTSTSNVLDDLNAAFNAGRYSDVVYALYPQALKEGYQRNAALYNNTRRALRQLMREDGTDGSWRQMQSLYADRFRNVGRETYEYTNNLEANTWSDEQLQNEYVLALSNRPDAYNDSYVGTLRIVEQAQGRLDLAIILQGMFAPLNRASVAHPEISSNLSDPYQSILRWIDASESFMTREHNQEYITHYPQSTIESVRKECLRVINSNLANEKAKVQQQKEELDQEYVAARNLFNKGQYTEAYNACNEALRTHSNADLRALKSNILQTCGTKASNAADRVAFYIAAYDAGRGAVSAQVLSGILDAIRANLFMSGIAGTTHTTRRPMIIRQRIWTLEELKEKGK